MPIFIQEQDRTEHWMHRWPWYVIADNLTPEFGGSWSTHNLYAKKLAAEYLESNPQGIITQAGKRTLGAINFGIDKFRLDEGFAKFLISRIKESIN